MKKLLLITLATLVLSGCNTLDSEKSEEISIGHAKCKEAGFETEVRIEVDVIIIKCIPITNN